MSDERESLDMIAAFAAHQRHPMRHPYTCGKRGAHPIRWNDQGVLYPAPQPDGTPILVCPDCDYTQPFPGVRATDPTNNERSESNADAS